MADLGGSRLCPPPPFETFFYKCSPPFCTRAPPPPDVDGAPEKKVSESPPLISFFLDLREFRRGWRRTGKKQYVVPPLFQIPGSAPGYVYHRKVKMEGSDTRIGHSDFVGIRGVSGTRYYENAHALRHGWTSHGRHSGWPRVAINYYKTA